jgi:hypothetical protein
MVKSNFLIKCQYDFLRIAKGISRTVVICKSFFCKNPCLFTGEKVQGLDRAGCESAGVPAPLCPCPSQVSLSVIGEKAKLSPLLGKCKSLINHLVWKTM